MSVYFQIKYYNTNDLKAAEARGEPVAKEDWYDQGRRHETGKEAADAVASLKGAYPENTFTIVRIDTLGGDRNWIEREMHRLYSGQYKPIPSAFPAEPTPEFRNYYRLEQYEQRFANVSFQQYLMEQNPTHFPHLSQNNERKIAFTESADKGRRDIQKVLSPLDYFTRHLSSQDRDNGVIDLLMAAMGGYDIKLHITETVEEMVETYLECNKSQNVGSCMTHPVSDYSCRPHHPVEPYALGGDLKLAYVRSDGDKGDIWGRCLVWPERKVWGRIYSTNDSLMRKALRAAGYEREVDALVGARLGIIRLDGDQVVMPYIDGSQRAYYCEDTDQLTIADDCEGNTNAGSTNGTGYLADDESAGRTECDNCGERYDPDYEGRHVTNQGDYCDSCADRYTFYCDGYDEVYDHRNVDMYNVGDQTYSAYYYENHCFQCEACDEDFHNDDLCFDEPTNQALCTNCHSNLEGEREEALDTIAQIITGNWEATEPAPETAPVINIDMSGLVAPSNIPSGITVPIGFAVWQPQRPHHAPQFWTNYPTLSVLVTTDQLLNNIPQGELRYASWNFDSTDSHYIVPRGTITGEFTPYSLAAAA